MASRLTPAILALIAAGDATLVLGALGVAGAVPLPLSLALGLLGLGLCLNLVAVVRVVRAARGRES